jgi:hypothetical protein
VSEYVVGGVRALLFWAVAWSGEGSVGGGHEGEVVVSGGPFAALVVGSRVVLGSRWSFSTRQGCFVARA